jgi:hypothetical protein
MEEIASSELAKDFLIPRKAIRATRDCPHEVTKIRCRKRRNESVAFVEQCLHCGKELRAVSRHDPRCNGIPERFDEELNQDGYDLQHEQWVEQYNANRKAQHEDWLCEHTIYLQTPEWRAKRAKVLQRDNYICQGCLTNRATQVHHLSYEHWQHELLYELVSICDDCHEQEKQTRAKILVPL